METGEASAGELQGFCSRFCRGLYLLFMLALFGAGVAVLALCWPNVVRSTRLCCCCIYAGSVVFCAGLLGAGCLLAERSPRYLREDGLVLLGLGLLGLLFVALYALAGRKAPGSEEALPLDVPFLGQLSRSRLSSSSAVELCKTLFSESRAFAPQRLQEDKSKLVVLCVLQPDAGGPSAKTVHFVDSLDSGDPGRCALERRENSELAADASPQLPEDDGPAETSALASACHVQVQSPPSPASRPEQDPSPITGSKCAGRTSRASDPELIAGTGARPASHRRCRSPSALPSGSAPKNSIFVG
ncbi:unnamed protein product [Ixodes pacificus]